MTGSYNVLLKRSAEAELRAIPPPDLRRVTDRMRRHAADPRPQGSEKLSGQDRHRARQGDYRIVYEVDGEEKIVTVVRIGHRREVYRD